MPKSHKPSKYPASLPTSEFRNQNIENSAEKYSQLENINLYVNMEQPKGPRRKQAWHKISSQAAEKLCCLELTAMPLLKNMYFTSTQASSNMSASSHIYLYSHHACDRTTTQPLIGSVCGLCLYIFISQALHICMHSFGFHSSSWQGVTSSDCIAILHIYSATVNCR